MRIQEFADTEEQIILLKMISDPVWNSIKPQAIDQERKPVSAKKRLTKGDSRAKTYIKPKAAAALKPTKLPKRKQATGKSDQSAKHQKARTQTQVSRVLPNVLTSNAKSNLARPQTPATSAAIQSAKNIARSRSERLAHDPNSVANIQRQLDPLSSSDVVKRLTS